MKVSAFSFSVYSEDVGSDVTTALLDDAHSIFTQG